MSLQAKPSSNRPIPRRDPVLLRCECRCDCHKAEPFGWRSATCCPDCGPSIVQIPEGEGRDD
jgi:hypothetical protein